MIAPCRPLAAQRRLERPVPPALDVLWEDGSPDTAEVRGHGMPPSLSARYGGDLRIALRADRPTVLANFVSTLDGVVALGPGKLAGGGLISGFHEPDRFVMALLRALSDVVLVGAGTVRGSTSQRWTAAHLRPDLAAVVSDWRTNMGLAPHPTTVILSGQGDLPAAHPGLNDPSIPVVVATTSSGAKRLAGTRPAAHVRVIEIGADGRIRGHDIVGLTARLGARVVLSEGGPRLLAQLVDADLLDELFLTTAPQLAGRAGPDRLGLVEGGTFAPARPRWHELASVRRSDSHLFLRYRRSHRPDRSQEQ